MGKWIRLLILPSIGLGMMFFFQNCSQISGFEAQHSITPVGTSGNVFPPFAPVSVSASPYSTNRINVSWVDSSNDEDGFVIEAMMAGTSSFTAIATLPANSTSYAHTGLSMMTTYSYRIRSYNSAGSSAYSNSASATTLAINTTTTTLPATTTTTMPSSTTTMVTTTTRPVTTTTLAPTTTTQVSGATYTWLNTNVFQPKCVGCHGGSNPRGGYSMTTFNNVRTRVVPGNANASDLYLRTDDGSMPQGGAPLSSTEMNALRAWINAGALNN